MLYEFDHQQTESISVHFGIEFTDEQLMTAIQERSEKALETLRRRHWPLLKTVAGRILNNDADTEDLLQETTLEIWNRAERYDEAKGKALGWIVTLVRRRAIDKVRRKEAYARAEDRLRVQTHGLAEETYPSTDDEAMDGDRAEILRRLMATLPAAQREAIQLAYYSGFSQRDIAKRTGISLGTIKTRIELGVKKLRVGISEIGERADFCHVV